MEKRFAFGARFSRVALWYRVTVSVAEAPDVGAEPPRSGFVEIAGHGDRTWGVVVPPSFHSTCRACGC